MNESSQTDIETDPVPPGKRRWRRRLIILSVIIALILIFVGPWPADNSHFEGSSYKARTIETLRDADSFLSSGKPLFAAVAEIDITPPAGHPLAGYGNRDPMDMASLHSRCYGRALTLQSGEVMVTILATDLLLVMGSLRDRIISKTGLRPAEIYFTSTHTHSGPGGFVDGFVEEMIMGSFDEQYMEKLAGQLSSVILESRKDTVQVTFSHVCVDAAGMSRNRVEDNLPTYDRLTALVFTPVKSALDNSPLAMLVSYAAHPTILRSKHRMLSSEYPGVVVDQLRSLTGTRHVLFAAGAMGDSKPKHNGNPDYALRMKEYGSKLASLLVADLHDLPTDSTPPIGSIYLPVHMPSVRVPIGRHFCLSPITSSLLTDRVTHISCLQIGNVLLVGMPGDYSGALAGRLEDVVSSSNMKLMLTSFNGDYKGYFVTSDMFNSYGQYETRTMNFFGPWGGEYLNFMAEMMVTEKLIDLEGGD